MIDHYYSQRKSLQRLGRGPLAPHLHRFAGLLAEQGYSKRFAQQKLRLVADLSRWLEQKHLEVEQLNERQVAAFFKARWQRRRRHSADPATLALLIRHLRQSLVIPAAVRPAWKGPLDRMEGDYARFLIQERGLSQATLDNYLPVAVRFLSQRFGAASLRLDRLRPQDVAAFVLRDTSTFSPKRVQLMTSALRSFLGFLYQRGRLATNLAASVPTAANGRSSDLPQFLQPEQVEGLLQSCHSGNPAGQRDYAVLLLLARLGLRAGEVVHLGLKDIHWAAGEVIIRGKSAREDRLPLPHDVGRALAAYLKNERPRCLSRRVFIRAVAPHVGFFSSAAICCIVRRALARARLHPEHKGAHLLRHSLATKMLRCGASLTQIGQILRHQRTQTTEIYAKVDLMALRALAQPWPGGVQ
jgi:site-specific recombinase XerD